MNESLVVVLLIGLLVGWVAGNAVRLSGLGLAGDLTVGLVGAFLGHWLLPAMHIHLGYGLVALVADATVGAVVLLLVFGLISFSRNWKGSAETVPGVRTLVENAELREARTIGRPLQQGKWLLRYFSAGGCPRAQPSLRAKRSSPD